MQTSSALNPGVINPSVTDGAVLLDDHVPRLSQKRLAGVLAWWVSGSRDIINGMAVEPDEDDNDEVNQIRFALCWRRIHVLMPTKFVRLHKK
ncbi:hypothetical protein [Candidatus Nitrospira salsa]